MVVSSMRRALAPAGAFATMRSASWPSVNITRPWPVSPLMARIAAQMRSRGVSLPQACRWIVLRAMTRLDRGAQLRLHLRRRFLELAQARRRREQRFVDDLPPRDGDVAVQLAGR